MEQYMKCWNFFGCEDEGCPVYQSREPLCWLVSGTHCRNEIQGMFLEKIEMCLECEPFKVNVSTAAFEETLKVVHEQFSRFRRMVDERDRELEGISLELALGLSEVFEALKKLSSGDPSVKIPVTSDLELITKLKNLVNLTAENLAEIVDLSHEFAIGLAEHFDALHRVSRGDLTARVSGGSEVEILESLKNVTNEMIISVHTEMTERKRAEQALQEAHDKLEMRVKERTEELTEANRLLKQEIGERQDAQDKLRESEQKYSSLVENSLTGIYIDDGGKIVFANEKFAEIYGYPKNELIGMESWRLVHPGDRPLTDHLRARRLKGEYAPLQYEARGLTKSGETIWLARRNTRIEYQGRYAILGNVEAVTERKEAEEKLRIYHNKLRSLASELSLAEERQRRGVAVEVHDRISQNLAFIKMKLGTLEESTPPESIIRTREEVLRLVDETIQNTRTLIAELGSPILYELGFVPALEWLTQQVKKQHAIQLDFEDDGQSKPLSEDAGAFLFQASRELLINVVKHAQASTAKVSIARIDDQIRVRVEDDGVGFDSAETDYGMEKTDSFGLFSIRERLEPLGGYMEMNSKPGRGTRMTLVVPLKDSKKKMEEMVS
jgi:PAS domain S-box-containing protein